MAEQRDPFAFIGDVPLGTRTPRDSMQVTRQRRPRRTGHLLAAFDSLLRPRETVPADVTTAFPHGPFDEER